MRKNASKSLVELNPDAKELKDLTLLIDKDLVGESFVKDFSAVYKYKFEFVESARIEQAILNNEKNVAFIFEYCQLASNGKFATLLYVYRGNDLDNIFSYFPTNTGIGYVDLAKALTSNFAKNYAVSLNECIE